MNASATGSGAPAPARGLSGTAALIAANLLGLVFVVSAITKMMAPKAFVASIEAYGFLPAPMVLPGATGIVGLEVALGLLLVLGFARRVAAWISLPLVLMFIGFVVYGMRAGLASCGCFGEAMKIPPAQELILDLVLLVLVGLVIWRGRDVQLGSRLVGPTLGWGALAAGAAIFLAQGPVASSTSSFDVTMDDLAVLAQADPPVTLGDDAFLFFFSADCDHCWAYAGGVQLMHDRVEGLPVHAITSSDRLALEAYEDAFAPTYPIHVLDRAKFDALVKEYPAAVWIQAGGIAQTWSGFVPSLRQIAESGGYFYRSAPPTPTPVQDEAPTSGLPDFGGTLGTRRQ